MPSQEVWMPWLTNLPRQQKNSLQTIYYMGVSENSGTPKSSISIEFSIINHPFWGTPNFWKHTYIPWAPKTIKNKGFGRLKTRLFTKTSQNVGLGGPMVGKQKPTKKAGNSPTCVFSSVSELHSNQAGGKTNMENSTSNFLPTNHVSWKKPPDP